jgi:type I restriction enzyme S subunit
VKSSAEIFDNKLKDFCLVGDGAHASIRRQSEGILYLTSKNFKATGLDLSKSDFISESDYKKYFENSRSAIVKPSPGDVVFGIIGSIGTPYIVKSKDRFGLSSSVAIVRPSNELDSTYLYYYMTSKPFQLAVEAIKSGVAQSFLSLEMIRNLPLIKPDLSTQRKIAAILTAYDDLIETNKRRIALLEKMAEEIYREWFVRLRFPGYQSTQFIKGIPEGWETISLANYCEKVTDGTHDTPKPSDSGHLLVTGKNIKNFQVDFSGAYFISENDHREISRRSGLKEGDILYSNIGTVGQITIIEEKPDYSVKNIIIFRPYNANDSLFLFHLLKNSSISESLLARSSGASQQFIGLRTVREFEISKPKANQIELFGKMVIPLFEQRKLLIKSNSILNASRDLLLPRLISGKLPVEHLDIQTPPSMNP